MALNRLTAAAGRPNQCRIEMYWLPPIAMVNKAASMVINRSLTAGSTSPSNL